MTLAVERKRMGRRPFQYVELDLDYCQRTYGVAPCTASLANGMGKCFNTRASCQDPANYSRGVKTYRFCVNTLEMPDGFDAFPFLKSISLAPTKLVIGKGLGERASVSLRLRDAPHHDIGIDPYVSDRAYTPYAQGSFFGKLFARNPYYIGRPLRIYTGYVSASGAFDLTNFERSLYFIDKVTGPDMDGAVTITAKDVLKFSEDKRAQAPRVSQGRLLADLTAVATSATLTPVGIGAAEYAASGTLRINDELATFTRAGDVLTLVRAQHNTVAAEHKQNDAVQQCLVVGNPYPTGKKSSDIVYDLLVNYAGVDPAFINLTAWHTEDDTYIQRVFAAVVATPTGVTKLLTELAEQTPFYIWWNERTSLIEFRAIRPTSSAIGPLNDSEHLLKESVDVQERSDLRVSQVWIYFGLRSPALDSGKPESYKALYVTNDSDTEGENKYGESAVRRIFGRWLHVNNRPAAESLASKILTRFAEIPREIQFDADPKDAAIWTGDLIRVATRAAQDFTGVPKEVIYQVMEAREVDPGSRFQYSALEQSFIADSNLERVISIDVDTLGFNLRTAHDSIYSAPLSGTIVRCIIRAGVKVGSQKNSGQPALTTGDWPAGVSITIQNLGRIQGYGGDGGLAHFNDAADPGGDALHVAVPVSLDNSLGQIWSGGGGGASRGFVGGGGGQGFEPGLGNINNSPNGDATPDSAGPGASVSGSTSGAGGAAGQPGNVGTGVPGVLQDPGAAGISIRGAALITVVGAPGSILGPQV